MTKPSDPRLLPAARRPIMDPALTRPDWTGGVPRQEGLQWLDKNENPDPELAALAAQVLARIPPRAIGTYPECAPLYRKLAAKLGTSPRSLLLTAGSDGAIRAVFEAFVNAGDVVLHTNPTFAMYPVYCRMFGAAASTLDYAPSPAGPRLAAERVLEALRRQRPKLLCLPNPDSPTGTVFLPGELRRILEAAGEVGALVLVDEAYYPFYDWTALPWISEFEHLVVARTFAKAWGLAGLRIGYAAASPGLCALLHKTRPMYEVNSLAVFAAEAMLDHEEAMRSSVRRLNEGKAHFLDEMEALDLKTLRNHGNFLHVAFGQRSSAVFAALDPLALYRKDFKDPCLAGYSRFSSTPRENFDPLIGRIRSALSR